MATPTISQHWTPTSTWPGYPSTTTVPADVAQRNATSFHASIPVLIFICSAIGGIIAITVIGVVSIRAYKKKEAKKEAALGSQESQEAWLARQNLQREETKNYRMSFGNWFSKRASTQVQGGVAAHGEAGGQADIEMGRVDSTAPSTPVRPAK
jgi:hypothetical protein